MHRIRRPVRNSRANAKVLGDAEDDRFSSNPMHDVARQRPGNGQHGSVRVEVAPNRRTPAERRGGKLKGEDSIEDVFFAGFVTCGNKARNISAAVQITSTMKSRNYDRPRSAHFETCRYNEIFLLRLALQRHHPSYRYFEIQCSPDLRNSDLTNHPGLTNQFLTSNFFELHKTFGLNEYPGLTNNWLGPQ